MSGLARRRSPQDRVALLVGGVIGARNAATRSEPRAGGSTLGIGASAGRRALVAEKVDGLPEVFARRHEMSAAALPRLLAVGGEAPARRRVGGDLFLERLEIGGSRGRGCRSLRGGRGGDRQFISGDAGGCDASCCASLAPPLCDSLRLSRLLRRWRTGGLCGRRRRPGRNGGLRRSASRRRCWRRLNRGF